METTKWNAAGREANRAVCRILEGVIDDGKPGAPFPKDARSAELANAVLAEVVALNAAGRWREARERFDPAHAPFVPHMEKTELQGLTEAVILGPDAFLVRQGDDTENVRVLHLDGDAVRSVEGAVGFAISQDRRHLALATQEGVHVTAGLFGARVATLAWPKNEPICSWRMSVSDDGQSVVLGNDTAGLWLGRAGGKDREAKWIKLAPREHLMGPDDDESYDEIDVLHAALSPDGRFVAFGWQDAPGHVIERIGDDLSLERWAVVEGKSDYPYNALFTSDSKAVLLNSRHMQSGVTSYAPLEVLKGLGAYEDLPDDGVFLPEEYLRAYGMVVLPTEVDGGKDPLVWVGGQGWSHAAPVRGGKPTFTHSFGSSLHAFDFDPVSKRAVVASASGMLHVLDPFARDEHDREQGYRPRREVYRWIFWDTLATPIRW